MIPHDTLSRRPEPTRLLLLDQVHHAEPGLKIRFLGCVYEYRGDTATLLLKASFTSRDAVRVNVQNVLESTNHELLEVGAWLNIVGYVRRLPSLKDKKYVVVSNGKQRRSRTKTVIVDATLLWTAGAIKLEDYHAAVQDYTTTSLEDV